MRHAVATAAGVLPPCVLHEDEHLLVVAKPAGWNTHAPAPYAGEGIYEWLRDREPRWAQLAIVHRLDKETSGVLAFAKTPLASRSLTAQFTRGEVQKRYELLTDRAVPARELRVEAGIMRTGGRYRIAARGERAVTLFRAGPRRGPHGTVIAEPLTGRTHQIRVHAAARGFPVLGDVLYGGSPAPRLCLHAVRLALAHPASGETVTFESPADLGTARAQALRAAFIEPAATDAYRMAHGEEDGWPGARVDRLGPYLLHLSPEAPDAAVTTELLALGGRGVYSRRLARDVRRLAPAEASPDHVAGQAAPARFTVRENGVLYELGLEEGYSVGLFLDQRDNRRRLLVNHVGACVGPALGGSGPHAVLNAFSYTCGFSVCAALAGAQTVSLDLSRKYLDWGRRNFELNGLGTKAHEFIRGDAFDWLRRLARKGRAFDAVLLDPPTFSQTKEGARFQAENDYGRLVQAAAPLLRPGGVLFASTNAARVAPAAFLETLQHAVCSAGRRIEAVHYAPQPPDFPISRAEPAYFKSAWLRLG